MDHTMGTMPTPPTPSTPLVPLAVLDAMLEAACLVAGRQLRIRHANPAAAALWGSSAEHLCELDMERLSCTPEDMIFWMEASLNDAAASQPLHSDTLIRREDGQTVPVERRVTLLTPPGSEEPEWLVSWIDQSHVRQLEDELNRLTGELGAALDGSRDGVLVTDLQGEVRAFNTVFAQMWSLPEAPDTRQGVGNFVNAAQRRLLNDDACRKLAQRQRIEDAGAPLQGCITERFRLTDGRTLECRLLPQYGRGSVVGWMQIWTDLTQQLAQQARLHLAASVFDNTLDAILVVDESARIVAVNPAAEHLCERSAESLTDLSLPDLVTHQQVPHDDTEVLDPWRQLQEGAPRWEGSLWLKRQGGLLPLHVSLVHQSDLDLGAASGGNSRGGWIAVLRDLSEQQAWQERLHALRMTDPLTGLPNRARLVQVVDELMAATHAPTPSDDDADPTSPDAQPPAQPEVMQSLALLTLGLDRFKHINDTFGHQQGDRVLMDVARRLTDAVRAGDVVARLDGDHFVVVLPNADAQTAELIARRLLALLSENWQIGGQAVTLSISAGIALYPSDADTIDGLLQFAEHAMREVKNLRGGGLRFYQPQMNIDRLARLKLDHAMRRALPQGRFSLHYQPQVDLRSGRIVGAEALCRWHDTELGDVSPGRFIPVAEETGFISELGDWVLREAVAQCARWHVQGVELPVSVNVSLLQFQQTDFVERVRQVLEQASLPARLLELELTESVLVKDVSQVLAQLHALSALGVQLAIDDFGTGYASLSYLKQLPIHRLKIDRSFIQRLPNDSSDAAITRTIVDLARAMGLSVIAEGVETLEQHAHLVKVGCNQFQGFLFSKPVPAPDFEAQLQPDLLLQA